MKILLFTLGILFGLSIVCKLGYLMGNDYPRTVTHMAWEDVIELVISTIFVIWIVVLLWG